MALGVALVVVFAARLWLQADPMGVEELNRDAKKWLSAPVARSPQEAYLHGRVLPVNRRLRTGVPAGVDAQFLQQLPPELRARTAKEVDTVLILDWGQKHHTKQRSPWVEDHGYTSTCTVTLIDRKGWKTLASKSFAGPSPLGTGNYGGEPPYKDMLAYVLRLPRR